MKKLLFTAITLLTITISSAQEEQGFTTADIFITGSLSIASNSSGDDKNSGFSVAPRVGYFATENIAIGIKLGYESTTFEPGNGDQLDSDTFEIGTFGRYYFTPATKFSIFGELGLSYLNVKQEFANVESTARGFNIGAGVGVSYFMSNNFALEALWGGLSYTSLNPEEGESSDNFEIGANLDNLGLGLIYKF